MGLIGLKWAKNVSKWLNGQNGDLWVLFILGEIDQNDPKMVQIDPKMVQNRPKWPKTAQKRSKMV